MQPSTTSYAPSQATTNALSALNSYKAPSATDVISQANSQYNVPQEQQRVSDLQGNVANLESSINAVDPSVTGRTSGTFTTEAQRQALVGAEQQPLQTDLSNTNTSLSNEETTLNQGQSNAATLASAMMTQNQDQYQRLLDAYNASAAQDKAAEQAREYYAGLGASGTSAPSITIGGGTPTPSSPGNPGGSFTATQRADKGFNFTDANGKPVSAAVYAAEKNIPFITLIQTMANEGDQGAKQLIGVVGNDYGYNPNKMTSPQLAAIYNDFVWGTNKAQAKPYTAPKVTPVGASGGQYTNGGNKTIFGQNFKL